MDPASVAAILRIAVPLGTALVQLFRTAGRPVEADELEAILQRSDAVAQSIIDRAKQELSQDD